MMQQLGLTEDDLNDVVFEEEWPPPAEATRWLAIAQVYTEFEYSSYWLFKNMHLAWDFKQEMKTRSLKNMHTFQFSYLGDWEHKVCPGCILYC
jgi:hypothetical protein